MPTGCPPKSWARGLASRAVGQRKHPTDELLRPDRGRCASLRRRTADSIAMASWPFGGERITASDVALLH